VLEEQIARRLKVFKFCSHFTWPIEPE